MKRIELDAMEAYCIIDHQQSLNEEIVRGLSILLKAKNPFLFEEHFSTLSKQLRMYDGEFIKGDEVKTRCGLQGRIISIIGEKPSEIVKILIEDYPGKEPHFVNISKKNVKQIFDSSEFVNESDLSGLPF